jgi:hypothetical protein
MKKLFVFLLILALGGYVFYTGWVQIGVSVGSLGIIRSKTHGTDDRPVTEGEFRWVWYKLIPNNVTLAVFTLKETAVSVSASGTLPSAATYAALAGVQEDFSYEIRGAVSCSLKADAVPALVRDQNLLEQADLDEWMRRRAGEIEAFVIERLWLYAEQETVFEEIIKTGTAPLLERELSGRFPAFENWNIRLQIPRFPDTALYQEIKCLHQDFMQARKERIHDEISDSALKNIQSRMRFEELSLYGDLLTKYPVLLEYLALEKGVTPDARER